MAMADAHRRCDDPCHVPVLLRLFAKVTSQMPDWLADDARKPKICEESFGAVLCPLPNPANQAASAPLLI